MDDLPLQTKRRKQAVVAAASLFIISCGMVILLLHNTPPSILQPLHPSLQLDIQNGLRTNHSAVRSRQASQITRQGSGTGNCIDFWHVSIAPDEDNTCTNSGRYPPEWAHIAIMDYMFHVTADDCCVEMLKPWIGFVDDNDGKDGGDGGVAMYGGGVPTCSIVDACSADDNSTTAADDSDDGCGGKSYMECVQDHECQFDEAATECVLLETLVNNADNVTSNITDMPDDMPGDNWCSGKTKRQCKEDPLCDYNVTSKSCMMNGSTNSDSDETDESASTSCTGKPRKACIKSKCQYDTISNTCTNSSSSSTIPKQHSDTSNNNDCQDKKYHPTSVQVRKCTNNELYPALWNSESMQAKYLLETAEECCATFYNDGSCLVDNVCSGTSDNDEGKNNPVAEYDCGEKSRRECIIDGECGWDKVTKVCLGNSDNVQGAGMPTNSPTSHCNVWHESSEAIFTCTNDGSYPELWKDPLQNRLFSSSGQCCQTRFNGQPCTILDSCIIPTTSSPTLSIMSTPNPTTPSPTLSIIPTPNPTPQLVSLANDGSVIDPSCHQREWHVSRDPKQSQSQGNTCTNDKRYPEAWLHPAIKPFYIFNTTRECCQSNFEVADCNLYDVCLEGTNPPTDRPTTLPTLVPTPNPWPTYSPSTTPTLPLYASAGTTCNARWHVSNERNAVNTCTNDSNFPKEWMSPGKRDSFLFGSAEKCCEAFFSGERCDLVNICPKGLPTMAPTTPAPQTEKPISKPKTPNPTSRPSQDVPWYVDRAIGKCVQSCEGSNPCGGKMGKWTENFRSAQDCCGSIPWIDFGECLTTPSPTGPPPPTGVPTMTPKTGKPTSRPTEAPTTKKPTMAPTSVPTIDCSAYKWHMSTREGDIQVCTNDEEYPEAWLESAQFFFHDTGDECCQSTFGGSCNQRDGCAGINKEKIDEAAAEAAEQVIKEEQAIKDKEEQAIKDKENEANQPDDGEDQGTGSDSPFVKFDGGMDDFEGDGTIPWILGGWKIESTKAFDGMFSITNIPVPSTELGAVSTLMTKIDMSASANLACKVYIDISMPFDRFSFHVNGEQRNVYHRPENEWITITSGIAPGSNTIEFQVTKGDMDPGFDRDSTDGRYGTGHVYVDQCNIR